MMEMIEMMETSLGKQADSAWLCIETEFPTMSSWQDDEDARATALQY